MAKKKLADDITWNAVQYAVTNIQLDEAYDEIDVTDTSTTGDGREFIGGRAQRDFSFDMWQQDNVADITLNDEQQLTLNFGGKTYVGQAIILSKSVVGETDQANKVTYSGHFNGAVTETPVT